MNSIFFRIYGGMVLAIILVSGVAYFSTELVNATRAEVYRERMARGTFYLMALGLQRQQSEEELERWRQVLARLVGAEIELLDLSDTSFDEDETLRLGRGEVVMRLDEQRGHADIYYQFPGEPRFIYARMTKVSEQQARATALLILDELAQYPLAEWDREFERIRVHFGFPLTRVDFNTLHLDREQLQRLQRREVVLVLDESGSRDESSVHVYAPIGNTGKVLMMGPMRLFEKYPAEMLVLVGVLGLVAMGLATYMLVRPLQTRLQRLGRAVEQVGRGNLDVKVEVKSSDAIGQLAATFNGMTEHIRRLIESQREMTRAVSHELRTPVARLRFGMEILADTPDEEVRHQKLDELDRDIDQLNELIDEILTFARLEEGSPAIEFEDIDVVALLERLQAELTPISQDIAIEIDPQALADLAPEDAIAEGSERYIHRIIQNLVTNAVRYAKSRVVLRYRSDGEQACIEVEDDGPGIPEADRERIFLPFSRLDDSRQRPGRGGGYGLGLSIVQRIADWHGGTVVILDGAEGGALFRVCWPRQRPVSGHVLGRL